MASSLRRAGGVFECAVLDLPAGRSLEGVETSGGVLLLPPNRTALVRAASFLEGADRFPWAVVCSRVGSGGSITPAIMSKELTRAVDVSLPCTPALRGAEDRGEFLSVRYRWTRSIMRLAKALDQL